MVDLSTEYLGLKLKNPLIAGSSGLSATAKGVREYEENGAAAVVLKSIFEEEIRISDPKMPDAQGQLRSSSRLP